MASSLSTEYFPAPICAFRARRKSFHACLRPDNQFLSSPLEKGYSSIIAFMLTADVFGDTREVTTEAFKLMFEWEANWWSLLPILYPLSYLLKPWGSRLRHPIATKENSSLWQVSEKRCSAWAEDFFPPPRFPCRAEPWVKFVWGRKRTQQEFCAANPDVEYGDKGWPGVAILLGWWQSSEYSYPDVPCNIPNLWRCGNSHIRAGEFYTIYLKNICSIEKYYVKNVQS